jgi:hypothetical protein
VTLGQDIDFANARPARGARVNANAIVLAASGAPRFAPQGRPPWQAPIGPSTKWGCSRTVRGQDPPAGFGTTSARKFPPVATHSATNATPISTLDEVCR